MPYRTVRDCGTRYALLAFDEEGRERTDDPDARDGPFSRRILTDLESARPTDVFILSHGWKGDMPAAIEQYDRWIAAMDRSPDRAEAERRRRGFRAFRIAVHWPSQPWGDEEIGLGGAGAFAAPDDPVELYACRLGDRPGLREAITTVFEAAARDPAAERLPGDAEAAYRRIDALLTEVGSAGAAAPPDDDRKPFDPQTYFEAAREEASFGLGSGGLGGILAPLRQLSFWKMKERGKVVGEGGMHAFLLALQSSEAGAAARIHLMGHSFGCIVVSAMVCGPARSGGAKRISSLGLVQGALSHWSYCRDVPVAPGHHGYFRRLLDDQLVAGPIVTTRSIYDTAVGRYYPLGAGVANQIDFAPGRLPRFGGIGSFGAQGLQPEATDLDMKPAEEPYEFEPGQVYNVEASRFIRKGDGPSGAHSDIDGPEVAHMIWSASLGGS